MAAAKQVVHMVWFKWPQVTLDHIAKCKDATKKLKDIKGVIAAEFGTNFSDRSRGFNLGLYVRFTDKAALEYYIPHPIHEDFKATVAEKEDVLAVDFEVEE